MRKTLQRTATVFAALLLCLSALLGLTTAQAGDSPANPIDFGISGMKTNRIVSASELFDILFEDKLTANEIAYLDGFSGISFVYNDAIPDSIVSSKYDGDNGTLRISLPPYRFTATNGADVKWVPTTATIGNKAKSFVMTGDVYVCEFDGLYYSGDFDVKIDFSWSATIPETTVDTLLTLPYADAEEALEALRANESEIKAFEEAEKKFLAHQAYLEAAEAYRVYMEVDKPAYDAAYAEYLVLKEKYDAYCEKLAAFEAWDQYWAYQEFMTDDVQQRYVAYQQYLAELAPIEEKLDILEKTFVRDSHYWTLYGSLTGDTVATVVNKKAELIMVGLSEADINQAGDSTNKLRELMKGYRELRAKKYKSNHLRLEALYDYYTTHYQELTLQFDRLYSSLKRLSDNAAVITEMSRRGKLEHFRQFIGQLYYTQAALDDAETLDPSMIVAGVPLLSAVEECQQITDSNTASPNGVVMPTNEVPKVNKVEQIDRPTFDEVHDRPTLAEFGLNEIPTEPTEPPVVEKPTFVEPAEDPGKRPEDLEMDPRLRAIAEDLRNQNLSFRPEQNKDRTVALTKSLEYSISISNLKTISFYSADGKTLLDRQTLEYGTPFSYKGSTDVQNRPSDEHSHYQFLGWIRHDGTVPSELRATENFSLYANYAETPRFYRVTWILDGVTVEQSVAYGITPIAPFSTVKESTAAATYAFSGWDKPISPVTGDVTYTASFLATPRSYTVTWIAGAVTQTQVLPYGTMPAFDGTPTKAPDGSVYDFLRWDREVEAVWGDVTYTALFSETVLAVNEYGEQLSVEHGDTVLTVTATTKRADVREAAIRALAADKSLCVRWSGFSVTLTPDQLPDLIASRAREIGILSQTSEGGVTVYRVGYLNSAGGAEPLELNANLQILTNSAGGQLVGYIETDGAWSRLESTDVAVTGEISFRIADVHKLTVSANEPVNLKNMPRFCESGSEVSLSLIGCEFGYEITSAALVLPDGSRQPITDASFVMPNGEVTLELTVSKIIYHVIFKVDGTVISSAQYGSGEKIQTPEKPTKASDELYSYTFAGWTPKVPAIAYGDERELVFEATFSKRLLSPNEQKGDRSIFYRFLGICIGVAVLLIAATVTTVLLLRRRKKLRSAAADAVIADRSDLPPTDDERTECRVEETVADSSAVPPSSIGQTPEETDGNAPNGNNCGDGDGDGSKP